MGDNSSPRTQKLKDRYQTNLIGSVRVVRIHSLVLVTPLGNVEVVPEISGKEEEVLVEEGISPSSRGSGIGHCHNADRRAENLTPTRVVGRTLRHEDELEEDCSRAPIGKPEAVSAVIFGVCVHPHLLLGRAVSSDRVYELKD